MTKKSNKIMVCVSPDSRTRERMLCELAVRCGFANILSDARKLIRSSAFDYDLSSAFFVLANSFNFRESPSTTQRLYELSAHGIAIMVGAKAVPREFEFLCDIYYPEHFNM
jgi:hypothetical protein